MAHDSGLDDETMSGGTPDDYDPTPPGWAALMQAAERVIKEFDRYLDDDGERHPEDLINLIDDELRNALEAAKRELR